MIGIMRWGAVVAISICVAGCGSSPQGESLGHVAQGVTSICGDAPVVSTFDGYPAFKYCGNFNVYSNDGKHTSSTPQSGWVQTEGGYGYQCVELAARYFHFRWGVPAHWGIMGANEMCGTHPSGVSKTTKPVPGDLMVFGSSSCGADPTYGHVGVVNAVGSTTITLVQQNYAAKYDYKKSCALCFLHAASNTGATGTGGSGGTGGTGGSAAAGGNAGAGGSAASSGGAGASAGAANQDGGWSGASGSSGWVQPDAGPGPAPVAPDAGTTQHATTVDSGGSCSQSGRRVPARSAFALLLAGLVVLPLRRRSRQR